MLSNKEAQIPNNLLSFAQKSPNLSAGIICAHHDSSMESAKKSVGLNLIEPIFIGDKNAISEKADKINWDISSYTIIHSSTCLLYTSPSPRDYAASRMPSSA